MNSSSGKCAKYLVMRLDGSPAGGEAHEYLHLERSDPRNPFSADKCRLIPRRQIADREAVAVVVIGFEIQTRLLTLRASRCCFRQQGQK